METTSRRFCFRAGRVVAKAAKRFVENQAWLRDLDLDLVEESGLLDITFRGQVSGSVEAVDRFASRLIEEFGGEGE